MPGISDKRALKNAILDSLSINGGTEVRLSARGLKDVKPAMRLREIETNLLREWEPDLYEELANECMAALKDDRTGNHYYYKWAVLLIELVRDKNFRFECRSKDVDRSFAMAGKMVEIKLPAEVHHESITSLPEGYDKLHRIYLSLRALYDKIYSLNSQTGKHRGSLSRLNNKKMEELDFQVNFSLWKREEEERMVAQKRKSPYSSSMNMKGLMSLNMTRISDLTYLKVRHKGNNLKFLFTPNHFERSMNLVKQLSNALLGILIAYGQDGEYDSNNLVDDILMYLKYLFRLGLKDDLAVGESGKAITDLYKAKLSQTDELPWNNFNMLLSTYSSNRRENALDLWSEFGCLRHDPDVKLNCSYLWKLAAQPDSDIRADFKELTLGLSSPNPIKPGSDEMIELAIRRAVFVGALRENRQVHVTAVQGQVIPPQVLEATAHSRIGEHNLRNITYGMMKGLRIKVNNVFPDPKDVSHLLFKDKSSAVDTIAARNIVEARSVVEEQIIAEEDEIIRASAEKSAHKFLKSIKTNPTKKQIDWAFKATTNDILSSLDENIGAVFREAEKKFHFISKSLRQIKVEYGGKGYQEALIAWAKENPELLINTATEPKYGEVHKRSVRIFYMFEKGMKTFLSQFERIARVVGYYIKGAEIVKGDRAREQHMNVLSSAHRASCEGILAYQILFDLSKFSQKFNHKIIDAATRVIGELVNYPDYAHISDLFKAAFLFVSARNTDSAFVGVLGAFEGFLNFLWTNIHATVMDIALKNCGRSGDLAAYSDDGLLMFTMRAKPGDPHKVIQDELLSTIDSIKNTYSDFGLDFNLGKTLISRNLSEFLGVVQYKGHRLPTWMKELCHIGVPDENKLVKSIGHEITDITSQMSAAIKAGMPVYAATLIGYSEVFMGPGRRLFSSAKSAMTQLKRPLRDNAELKAICLFLCLNQSFGGVRLPDPLTIMMTADYDPITEMLVDLKRFQEIFKDKSDLRSYLLSKIDPTDDYVSVFLGSSPVHTKGVHYSPTLLRDSIISQVKGKLDLPESHPISRNSVPYLHQALEGIFNLYLPLVTSMARYIIPVIIYNKLMAPSKSSSIARLLKKTNLRRIQGLDTRSLTAQIKDLMLALESVGSLPIPSADELYRASYPKLSISAAVPSPRDLIFYRRSPDDNAYTVEIERLSRLDDKGSHRLLNQNFRDDLVPPLVTTNINIQHLMNAPDLVTHCMRNLYSELISSSAQGHDLLILAEAISRINKCRLSMPNVLSSLRDVRKVAVANRKKSVHRVYWAEATKSAVRIKRGGKLNHMLTIASDLHFSLIVTSAFAYTHLLMTSSKVGKRLKRFYLHVDKDAVDRTKLLPMYATKESLANISLDYWDQEDSLHPTVRATIRTEVMRTIESTKQELTDNLMSGRMSMLPDFNPRFSINTIFDPLRYAIVWSLVSKLESVSALHEPDTGVTPARIMNSSLDTVPMDLVDLALIYHSYTKVRKSRLKELSAAIDHSLLEENPAPVESILDENIALEALASAERLGLIHSMDVDKLRDPMTGLQYQSMVTAQGMNMVYYSLDAHAETMDSEKFSPARVKALKRVVDAIVSNEFSTKQYTTEDDFKKFTLMLISGSLRGSVHRDHPFNENTTYDWGLYLIDTIEEFLEQLDEDYCVPISGGRDPKFEEIPPTMAERLRKMIENPERLSVKLPRRHGTPDQYIQLIIFLVKLAKWGFLPRFLGLRKVLHKLIPINYLNRVLPAMKTVRTVSYNSLEKALTACNVPADIKSEMNKNLESAIHYLSFYNNLDDHRTPLSFLDELPHDFYRDRGRAPFDNLSIAVNFPNETYFTFPSSIAFSMAMPLVLASGWPCFNKISILGGLGTDVQDQLLKDDFELFCLPSDKGDNGLDLGILVGVSESVILRSLHDWLDNHRQESMVVVEIPPTASAFSLGLIAWLTSGSLSYVSVALSSDKRGVSLYVVSILEGKPLDRDSRRAYGNSHTTSLGDAAIERYVRYIAEGQTDILGYLFLSPLQQVGIPAYATIIKNGETVALAVEEELLDRHRVSFIESSRPSKTAELYSSLDPRQAKYLLRCYRVKEYRGTTSVKIATCFVYYIKSFLIHAELAELMKFVSEFIELKEEYEDQLRVLRHLAANIVSLPPYSLNSFQASAQVDEPGIPHLDFGELLVHEELEPILSSLFDRSSHELMSVDEKRILLEYIRDNLGNLDPEQAWKLIAPKRKSKRVAVRAKIVLDRGPIAPAPILSVSSDRYLLENRPAIAERQLEIKEATSSTQALFASTFSTPEVLRLEKPPDPGPISDSREDKITFLKEVTDAAGHDNELYDIIDAMDDDELTRLSELRGVVLEDKLLMVLVEKRDERFVEEFGVSDLSWDFMKK